MSEEYEVLSKAYNNFNRDNIDPSTIKFDNVKMPENDGKFENKGREIGKLVDKKQRAYGDSITKTNKLLKIFLEDYNNGNGTYTIPESLLDHIGLQVRMLDKVNRIFSNPDGDLMEEKPYNDLAGYSLLGNEIKHESNN